MHTDPLPDPTDPAAVRRWTVAHQGDPATVRAWAAPLLEAAAQTGPTPHLGTPAWQALPTSDPRKHAAVIRAALVWLAETTPSAVGDRVRAELDAFATAVRRMFAEAHDDYRRAHIELGYSTGPSHAELVRRRRLTTTATCGSCGTPVTLVHPLPAQHAARLPDLTWVRCPDCNPAGSGEIDQETAA